MNSLNEFFSKLFNDKSQMNTENSLSDLQKGKTKDTITTINSIQQERMHSNHVQKFASLTKVGFALIYYNILADLKVDNAILTNNDNAIKNNIAKFVIILHMNPNFLNFLTDKNIKSKLLERTSIKYIEEKLGEYKEVIETDQAECTFIQWPNQEEKKRILQSIITDSKRPSFDQLSALGYEKSILESFGYNMADLIARGGGRAIINKQSEDVYKQYIQSVEAIVAGINMEDENLLKKAKLAPHIAKAACGIAVKILNIDKISKYMASLLGATKTDYRERYLLPEYFYRASEKGNTNLDSIIARRIKVLNEAGYLPDRSIPIKHYSDYKEAYEYIEKNNKLKGDLKFTNPIAENSYVDFYRAKIDDNMQNNIKAVCQYCFLALLDSSIMPRLDTEQQKSEAGYTHDDMPPKIGEKEESTEFTDISLDDEVETLFFPYEHTSLVVGYRYPKLYKIFNEYPCAINSNTAEIDTTGQQQQLCGSENSIVTAFDRDIKLSWLHKRAVFSSLTKLTIMLASIVIAPAWIGLWASYAGILFCDLIKNSLRYRYFLANRKNILSRAISSSGYSDQVDEITAKTGIKGLDTIHKNTEVPVYLKWLLGSRLSIMSEKLPTKEQLTRRNFIGIIEIMVFLSIPSALTYALTSGSAYLGLLAFSLTAFSLTATVAYRALNQKSMTTILSKITSPIRSHNMRNSTSPTGSSQVNNTASSRGIFVIEGEEDDGPAYSA